jgi:hypothetical protein
MPERVKEGVVWWGSSSCSGRGVGRWCISGPGCIRMAAVARVFFGFVVLGCQSKYFCSVGSLPPGVVGRPLGGRITCWGAACLIGLVLSCCVAVNGLDLCRNCLMSLVF